MKIFQYAVPRSGSTLIYQILLELFGEDEVEYSHDFKEIKDKYLVITKRDFRDLVASHWRIWHAKFDKDGNITNKPTYLEVEGEIRTVKSKIKVLEKYYKFYEKYDKKLILDYEDFFENYEFIFNKFESFFGIKIDKDKRKDIINKTNLETKRKQQSKIPIIKKERIFDNYLDHKDVHANHIHPTITPEKGYWKKVFPKEFHEMINYSLEEELRTWGYWDE